MTELARIYVTDDSENPLAGAQVGAHRVSTGSTVFAVTNGDGVVELGLETEKYSISAQLTDYIAPASFVIEVSTPPDPTAAYYNPPAQANPLLLGVSKNLIMIAVDGEPGVEIDVTTPNPVGSSDDIVSNINAALAAVDPGWSAVASNVLGEIRLTSPTTGADSSISVVNDGITLGPTDATDAVFGLTLGEGTITVYGEDTPGDWNDYTAEMTPKYAYAASNPAHCVLWGKLWRHELANVGTPAPLDRRTLWIEILDVPTSVDVGIDVGDSFYVTSDTDGVFVFELMRGSAARMYISWLDKTIDFSVPHTASAALDAILAPYLVALTQTSDSAISMDVGETLSLSATGTFSDGSTSNMTDLQFSSSDSSVAAFSDSNAPSVLEALAPGTTVVQISKRNSRYELIESNEVVVTVT